MGGDLDAADPIGEGVVDLPDQRRPAVGQALAQGDGSAVPDAIDLVNTASWARSALVTLPKFLSEGKDRVVEADGQPVPSQRLRNGELVMRGQEAPSMAGRRYLL